MRGCVLCVLEREKTQESEKMCIVERKCVVVVWEKKGVEVCIYRGKRHEGGYCFVFISWDREVNI